MLVWIKALWGGQGCVASAKSQPTLSPFEPAGSSRPRSGSVRIGGGGSGGPADCHTPPPAGSSSDAIDHRMPDQAATAGDGGSRYVYSDGKVRGPTAGMGCWLPVNAGR